MSHDVIIQDQRAAYLDALYRLDNRDDPYHPSHGTYTGLYQQRIALMLEIDRWRLLKKPPFEEVSDER